MDQPRKVANPARGQLNRKNDISLSAFVPENLISWDGFGSPVPRQPAHLHTQAESGAYFTGTTILVIAYTDVHVMCSSASTSMYSSHTWQVT